MKTFFVLLTLTFFLFLTPGQSKAQDNYLLDQFYGLQKTWTLELKNGRLVEQWSRPDDTVLLARSWKISAKNDSLLLETIRLRQEGDEVFYSPTLTENGKLKTVDFLLVDQEENRWTFENWKNDFPQEITYDLREPGRLKVRLSAKLSNGDDRTENLEFFSK